MGAFLDGISIVVLTTAVLMPAIQAADIDPIWFGIYLILVVEMAQITPPVGFNLFVIQGITGRNLFELVRMAPSVLPAAGAGHGDHHDISGDRDRAAAGDAVARTAAPAPGQGAAGPPRRFKPKNNSADGPTYLRNYP